MNVCSGCGYATEEMEARFCPSCGGSMEAYNEPKSAPGPLTCKTCGNVAPDPNMKYCAKCGSAFEDPGAPHSAGQLVNQAQAYMNQTPTPKPVTPTVVSPTVQQLSAVPISPSKFENLTKLYSIPRTTVRIKNKKHGGKLVLAVEGIGFRQLGGVHGIRFLIPYSAIKDLILGKNDKSFIVYLMDGDAREFKVFNPKVWIDKTNEQRGNFPS